MLNPNRLALLREVARLGTIAAVADAAGYSPSAVSQQLAALEREAGLSLLDRSARSVRLTEPGRVLAEHAAPALSALRDAHAAARAAAALDGGRLRVGTFPSAGARLVPHALAQLSTNHPRLLLELRDLEPEDAAIALLDDRVDAVVTHEYELLTSPPMRGIERHEIVREPLLLAVPSDHTKVGQRRVSLEALAGERWIADTETTGPHAITEATCQRAGFAPDIAFRTADTLVAIGLVRARLGVALLPRLATEAVAGQGVVVLGLAEPVRRIVSLSVRVGSRHPGAQALLHALRGNERARAATANDSAGHGQSAGKTG